MPIIDNHLTYTSRQPDMLNGATITFTSTTSAEGKMFLSVPTFVEPYDTVQTQACSSPAPVTWTAQPLPAGSTMPALRGSHVMTVTRQRDGRSSTTIRQ